LCLLALYTARTLVNVELSASNINPRAPIFSMPHYFCDSDSASQKPNSAPVQTQNVLDWRGRFGEARVNAGALIVATHSR
jgi:hypothetical protein